MSYRRRLFYKSQIDSSFWFSFRDNPESRSDLRRCPVPPETARKAPTVDGNHVAGDVRRRLAAEEEHEARKVGRLADAPRRLAQDERVHELVHAVGGHPRREHAAAVVLAEA